MTKYSRLAIILLSFVLYLGLYLSSVGRFGVFAGVFTLIPVLAIAYFHGYVVGMSAALALGIIGTGIFTLATSTAITEKLPENVVGIATLLLVAYVVGLMRTLKDREAKMDKHMIAQSLGFDHTDDVIFTTDLDGVFDYVNPAFTRLYGFSADDIKGKTPRILKSGIQKDQFYKELWESLLAKKPVNFEMTNKTKDGKLVNVYQSANPIIDNKGTIIGFLSIQRDLTKISKVQDELLQRTRELERLNQIMVDRELKMISLKKTISSLTEKNSEKV